MQSILPDALYLEASALLCAQHAGLIADVLEEEASLTVFGRMSPGEFDFSINSKSGSCRAPKTIRVYRAQCEIDGGFEGAETFAILEVKNQEVNDFHIRQLYYPYRLWLSKISKRVIPIFLIYSNGFITREDTTTKYAFNIRQTNYYTDAGRYLGFIDKKRDTEHGRALIFL